MPITCATFLVGCLALSGVWPFAGFYSKDAIIAAVWDKGALGESYWIYSYLAYAALLTAALTAVYTFRAFFRTFYGRQIVPEAAGHHAHESPGSMTIPLVVLAICSIVVGVGFSDGFGVLLAYTPSLAYEGETPVVEAHASHAAHGSHGMIATVSTVIALSGIALAAFLYLGNLREVEWLARLLAPIYRLSHGKFFFDEIYTVLIVWPCLGLAWVCYWFDRHVVDGLVNSMGRVPPAVGSVLRSMQTGLVHLYAMLMVLGLLAVAALLLL
jgi:NADH-quinone oxidoreductase subunit L